eukprot:TRINITY_DN7100_c0_g1_i1.p1 TRINITY_DN7100_c0_g1~~TRINITY_DN7100_c0_g1_i1.p1  ORF type:complete len:517 (-),score=86.02 TRINITY_DN7100_c0_g1_i1:132-1682(-)
MSEATAHDLLNIARDNGKDDASWTKIFHVLQSEPGAVKKPAVRKFGLIHQAAYWGNSTACRILIDQFGADPQEPCEGDDGQLTDAAGVARSRGHSQLAEQLRSGAVLESPPAISEVSTLDAVAHALLDKAKFQGKEAGTWQDICTELVKTPGAMIKPSQRVFSLLHQAAFWGNRDACEMMVNKFGADPGEQSLEGTDAASIASSRGFSELSAWLEKMKDPNNSEYPKIYHDPLYVPDKHRLAVPAADDPWYAVEHDVATFSHDGIVSQALTPAQIDETLRPFKLLSRTGDKWERFVYDKFDTLLGAWPPGMADCGFSSVATWEIDSVRLIYDQAKEEDFRSVPVKSDVEPLLAFHGTQLCHFRSVVKNNFRVSAPGGWYGNGGYFTTNLPYSQHYIGGIKPDKDLARFKDAEHGILLPKIGHTVFIFAALVKPGNVSIVEKDTTPAGKGYTGKYRDQPKDPNPDIDSHLAYVSPAGPGLFGFRPVGDRSEAGADEFVIFDQKRVFPRFIVGLKRLT